MAKMTLTSLQAFVSDYVEAAKQAGTWNATTDNLYTLIDKIGKQVSLDGLFVDKLPEFDGEDLPLGKTIEEYFADLILPEDYDVDADPMAKHNITTEAPSYSYTLGRKVLKTTVPYDNVERAALTAGDASNMLTKITERLYQSEAMYKYAQKKQLLANVIAKVGNDAVQIAKPVNTSTAEAFIKRVKNDVETASFANEGNALNKTATIGAAPSLVLYITKGMKSVIDVDTLAGAFNEDKLGFGVEVKVIDDFGDDQSGAYAILMDPRGVKLHNGYRAVRTNENGDGDYVNFFLHSENTGFISKYTFVKVYKA